MGNIASRVAFIPIGNINTIERTVLSLSSSCYQQ